MESESAQWLDACIYIMNTSMFLGAKLYPLLCGLGIIRTIASII